MNISIASTSEHTEHSVFLVTDPEQISSMGFSDAERSYVEKQLKDKSFSPVVINRYTSQIVVIGAMKKDLAEPLYFEKLRIAGARSLTPLNAGKAAKVKLVPLGIPEDAFYFAEGLALASYQFLKYFSDAEKKKHTLKEIEIYGLSDALQSELEALVMGVFKARDLINEPLSHLTAVELAKEAQKAGEESGFSVEVLNKKRIQTLKMGGLLAVNRGSQDPPTFSILKYTPADAVNTRPIVLVGKGVVYDTGGLSLKPTPNSMDTMKSDMSGAAAVIGAITAIAKSKLPVQVIGLIPATDNRPGENAYVPGDVIKMYDGQTVEVLNTDAEGRMILADALAYAKKLNPEIVIDLATLTGSAAMAIGKYGVVAMGTAGEQEKERLSKAGEKVYERLVEFPIWEEYDELLKSDIADVKNIGGREGGAITAGKFLQRFTDYPWVHLDIAGPAFIASNDEYRLKGGTGVGVRLLHEFAKSRVQ